MKFTPLLSKSSLFSRVAPNKESIIHPKKPKKDEIYQKSTLKDAWKGWFSSINNKNAAKESIEIETDESKEATVPSKEIPPSVPGSTFSRILVISTGSVDKTPI